MRQTSRTRCFRECQAMILRIGSQIRIWMGVLEFSLLEDTSLVVDIGRDVNLVLDATSIIPHKSARTTLPLQTHLTSAEIIRTVAMLPELVRTSTSVKTFKNQS